MKNISRRNFIRTSIVAGDEALFRMEYVKVQCEDKGQLKWELTDKPGNRYLFHINQGYSETQIN
jgi:hypothetical protein